MSDSLPTHELLTEILSRHADALIVGQDYIDAELLAAHAESEPLLGDLLSLARRLFRAFVPVKPSPRFVTNLEKKLARAHRRQQRAVWSYLSQLNVPDRRVRVWGIAVTVFAAVSFLTRLIGSIVMLVVFFTGRRRRTVSAA
jgi:hypothetical protein